MSVSALAATKVALLYRRISKDDDGDELGVMRQLHALTEHATAQGWVIGGDFVDNDQSASKGKRREGYEALLAAVKAGEGDIVLCTEVSRLTRHPRELEDLVELVERTGVNIVALRAGQVDLSTSGGRTFARVLGAMARGEVEQMAERIASKIAEGARAGLYHGGQRPYGFDRAGTGRLKVNEAEAAVIREMADHILDDGWTINRCINALNERGVPTSTGSHWRDRGLRMVLTSPRVAGLRPVGTKDKDGRDLVPDHFPATWPEIIPRDRWERLRAGLAVSPRGRRPRSFLLAGFIFCGRCGYRLHSHASNDKRDGPRRRYRCEKAVNPNACGSLSIEALGTQREVIDRVLEAASGANIARVRGERAAADSRRLVAQVAEDETLLTDLAADLGAKRISRAEWLAARPGIEERLRTNRDQLKALGGGDQLPPDLIAVDRAAFDAMTFDQQRAVLKLFVERIIVDPPRRKGGGRFQPERIRLSWKA